MNIVTVSLIGVISSAALYQYRFFDLRNKRSELSWEELVATILVIDPAMLDTIRNLPPLAKHPYAEAKALATWRGMGGLKELRRLLKNVDAMLELAMYAERWAGEVGPVFSEMLRQDALALRRTTRRAFLGCFLHLGAEQTLDALFEAGHIYDSARRRLVALYANVHCALKPEIEGAFWPCRQVTAGTLAP